MQLLFNARIYTGFKNFPVVTALLIHEDRILATGTDDELQAIVPLGTPQQNLQGKTVLPGLTDSHLHFKHLSLSLKRVNCETATIDECLQNVADRARVTPAGEWIQGWGWNHNVWEGGYGTAEMLDRVAPENPVFLSAKSGHAAWVNTLAMKIAGLDASTQDPEGGVIQRDENNHPTGILFETAEELVGRHIPQPDAQMIQDAVSAAQDHLWKLGITCVHDFDTPDLFAVLQAMEEQQVLGLRVIKGIPLAILDHAVETGLRSGFGSDYVRIGSVKVFVDGALGPQTAAMLAPFENSQDLGILLLDSDEIYEIGVKAARNGLSLAIHAIGDLANRTVLDAYERLRAFEQQNNLSPLRHRIEHVQLLHPDDFGRLAQLHITASMQPLHATSDMYISDRYWGKRASGAYAFQTLLQKGTKLIFGSDAPVEIPDPFVGIHAAVTRRRTDGAPGEQGWYPQERIDLAEAFQAYTYAPAVAAGQEKRMGYLGSGAYADLIVLDEDPFLIPPERLFALKPSATMVAGRWVWQTD